MLAEIVPIRGPRAERGLQLEVVDNIEDFAGLRDEWNGLLARSDADTLFLTWEWLYTWWRHLRGNLRLHLVLLRQGEELVAAAPLAVRPGRLGGLLGRGSLEFLATGIVGSDYLDVIVRRGREAEALRLLAEHVAALRQGIDLRQLDVAGSAAGRLVAALRGRSWRTTSTAGEVCPYLSLAGHSWDSLLGSLGPEHRYNIKRRLRQLRERADVHFERVDSEERRAVALKILLDLHLKRWAERGGSDAFDSEGVMAFHEELSRLALAQGWLRLYVLWLDGEPAAALYGFRYGGSFSYYQCGFDPRFSRWSVGLVTLALAVRQALDEEVSEFDLLHGNESYKSLWTQRARALVRLEADPPDLGALLHRRVIVATRAARRGLRRLLPPTLAARLDALRRRSIQRRIHVASTG
jgi:CelD/BcsL family acetyltransferase involved in cellulose biosynthesis